MKALVTGANGLIGANLVRELLHAGYKVRALIRISSDVRSLNGLNIELAHGDVLDFASLPPVVAGCDVIFHCAAMFSYWGMDPQKMEHLAVEGSRNIIRAAHQAGVARLVLTSSSVVLGSSPRPLTLNEQNQLDEHDNAPYVLTKQMQEYRAFEYADELEIELVAVCPTMSIGPHGYRLGPSNGVIVSYLNDLTRATFAGGCNIVSVQDIAKGHLIAAQTGLAGERYVLGSENLEWSAIHRMISELCGISGPNWQANHTVSYVASGLAEVAATLTGKTPLTTRAQAQMIGRYYWYDHSKIAALGYQPQLARRAMAQAISWLVCSEHISREVRIGLHLSAEVYQARKQLQEREVTKGV